jgi:SAM-dependent methyltransferase
MVLASVTQSNTVIRVWKVPPIIKGMLTHIPVLNAWRKRHATRGGTDSPRYCYSVWLRHLTMLYRHGFRISGARVGELGPGDSIGVGLAALLSGATQYIGLDIVPFSAKADLEAIFEQLVHLYSSRERVPDHNEFPKVRPRLESYEFPDHLIDWENFASRIKNLRAALRSREDMRQFLEYRAPWTSPNEVAAASLDLIFSQAVLEHVDSLEETYQAMSVWLKPGGYASHVIDFTAHGLSPFWNGHWAYADWEWKLVRGRREFLLNRQPLSMHISNAKKVGFQLLEVHKDYGSGGLNVNALSNRFQELNREDLQTRGTVLILRKQLPQ